MRSEQQAEPGNHLVFAIIVTILFCLPFGLIAVFKSLQVSIGSMNIQGTIGYFNNTPYNINFLEIGRQFEFYKIISNENNEQSIHRDTGTSG